MSLTISTYYSGFPLSAVSNTVPSPAEGSKVAAEGDNTAGGDQVRLSAAGRLAASGLLDSLMLPTTENVRQLSAALSTDLGALLADAGINPEPPLEFKVSPEGEIQIKGDRPDKEQILELINSNEQVQEEIRTTMAISSHAVGMAEAMKFQEEYLASDDPDSVVAKYADLFNSSSRYHDISLVYDGNGLSVMADGKNWLSSGA